MPTNECIYQVVETHVNGAQECATEFVKFESKFDTETHGPLFQQCLVEARQAAAKSDDDLDTADMVEMALVDFKRRTGILGILHGTPYKGTFVF